MEILSNLLIKTKGRESTTLFSDGGALLLELVQEKSTTADGETLKWSMLVEGGTPTSNRNGTSTATSTNSDIHQLLLFET